MIIYVDASKFGATPVSGETCGSTEWRGVIEDTEVKGSFKEIFRSKLYSKGHNNAAEFIALVDAVRYIQSNEVNWANKEVTVFTDSRTALAWFKKRICSTKLRSQFDACFLSALESAENWLASQSEDHFTLFNMWVKIWNSTNQIPADFDRK